MNTRELILLALCELFNLELADATGSFNGGKKFLPLLKLTFKASACSNGIRGPFMLSSYRSMRYIEEFDDRTINNLTYVDHAGEWGRSADSRVFMIRLTPKFYNESGGAKSFTDDFADTLEDIEIILPQ